MRMTYRLLPLVFCALVLSVSGAPAESDPKEGSGLPLPRMASLKSGNVYARTGPSMDYPIRWIYHKAGLPVEILQEFDVWRKIRDQDGGTAWVHKILLSGRRTAVISSEHPVSLWAKENGSHVTARLEKGVTVSLEECAEFFCKIEKIPFEGWIEKKFLWGVYPKEIFN